MSFDLKLNKGTLVLKSGSLELVRGVDKLIQEILKIALTSVGANPMHPWYGSFISKTLVGSHLDTDITFTIAKSQLAVAIDTLKNLQQRQASESFQSFTPDEQIASIIDISINRNKSDPRLYDVIIKVLSKSFTRSSTSFSVRNF